MAFTLDGKVRGSPSGELFTNDVEEARYVVTYQLTSDDPSNDTDADCLAAVKSQVGALASAYANDSNASLKNIRVQQSRVAKAVWMAEVEWNTEIDATQGGTVAGGNSGVAPADLSPEIEYDYEVRELEAEFDAFGELLDTSAGEMFEDTTVIHQRPITILTYSRWENSHPAIVQQTYMNRCNSTPFSGADTYTVLMKGIRARLRPILGTRLWWVTYTMAWDPQGWYLRRADIGNFFGSLSSPQFKYVDGRTVKVHMDGAGNEIGGGHSVHIHQFRPFGIVDFNTLNF